MNPKTTKEEEQVSPLKYQKIDDENSEDLKKKRKRKEKKEKKKKHKKEKKRKKDSKKRRKKSSDIEKKEQNNQNGRSKLSRNRENHNRYSPPRDNSLSKYKRIKNEHRESIKQEFGVELESQLNLAIHLYFLPEIIRHLVEESDSGSILSKIKQKTGAEKVCVDEKIHLTDLIGKVITISDQTRKKKEWATDLVLDEYQRFMRKGKGLTGRKTSLIILIPEAIVSLFIGYKGLQIKKMMGLFGTRIVVNQPIQDVRFRSVEIEGRIEDIRETCKACVDSLQKVARQKQVRNLEVKPKTPSIKFSQVVCKLVVHFRLCAYLENGKDDFIRELEREFSVRLVIYRDFKSDFVTEAEKILQISGKLKQVQNSVTKLIKRIHDCNAEAVDVNFERIKMVIPNIYVTKLIGAGGCMIREIAARSAGAQIKILSNKEKERNRRATECPVSIAGSLANKQDAVCLILEQLETFKGGGPVLTSGRVLGKNIATQYKHSIQAKDSYESILEKRADFDHKNVFNRGKNHLRGIINILNAGGLK